jgi:predicted transposase/invertase (TIGR01784 family)
MTNRNLIRFDWAIKRLLRNKADFAVLEGFLSVLLKDDIKIVNIKESESNQESADNKFNRVDIFVENRRGELMIIEIQNRYEVFYYLRMLYAVSKAIAEHTVKGERYHGIRKVYHINILYFKLGNGDDYVYCGWTEFKGLHTGNLLQLTSKQKQFFARKKRRNVKDIKDLFPGYYILCVDDFDNLAKDSLDEWIYYLKNNEIPESFTARGLPEARSQWQYDNLSEQERIDYDHHLKQTRYEQNAIEDATEKGIEIGLEKGVAIGLEKGRAEECEKVVINSHRAGLDIETISKITGLTHDEIIIILKRENLI